MKKKIAAAVLAAVLSVCSFAAPAEFYTAGIVAEAATDSAKKAELPAPENISAKVTTNSVVLTWDKVEGADAYRVYMYNAETKKYTKYKTVAGTKCTVKELESGTSYRFKVATLTKSGKKYVLNGISSKVTAKTKAASKKKAECDTWNGKFPGPEKYGFEYLGVFGDMSALWYANFDDDCSEQFKKYLKYLENCGCKIVHDEKYEEEYSYAYVLEIYDSTGKNLLALIASDFDFEMFITFPDSNK
ncbi:MAG: fibronectin type III domain-containing protein [Huintestinicola sp.]